MQYLEAMGFEALVSRSQLARLQASPTFEQALAETPDIGLYCIGPGSGQVLLLCQDQAETASKLASDIARCLEEVPVWGWRVPSSDASSGLDLATAIHDRLFTRVLVFGAPAAKDTGQAEVIGSARIVYAPSLRDLSNNPDHKRRLWSELVSHGWNRRFA